MISPARLRRGIRYPDLVAANLNKLYHTRLGGREYNHRGTYVFDQDWDNLVILDACRYDEFCRCADLPGQTDKKVSRGAASKEFVRGNFKYKDLRDTVYVSANTWYGRLEEELQTDLFAHVFVERDVLNGLTSSPEKVTEEAIETFEKYPNKRLVVHYMQPHRPYLGPKGQELFEPRQPFHEMFFKADATHQQLRECYRENLELVLESVDHLLEEVSGKSVVTSDHGELLGDRMGPIPSRGYGHPDGVYVDPLTEVPWHTVPYESRRDVIQEEPLDLDHDAAEVEERLKDLGYLSA